MELCLFQNLWHDLRFGGALNLESVDFRLKLHQCRTHWFKKRDGSLHSIKTRENELELVGRTSTCVS